MESLTVRFSIRLCLSMEQLIDWTKKSSLPQLQNGRPYNLNMELRIEMEFINSIRMPTMMMSAFLTYFKVYK